MKQALLQAVLLIKEWHNINFGRMEMSQRKQDDIFRIYYEQSPEMKIIRDTLGPYDEMKNEPISCTSETVLPEDSK